MFDRAVIPSTIDLDTLVERVMGDRGICDLWLAAVDALCDRFDVSVYDEETRAEISQQISSVTGAAAAAVAHALVELLQGRGFDIKAGPDGPS